MVNASHIIVRTGWHKFSGQIVTKLAPVPTYPESRKVFDYSRVLTRLLFIFKTRLKSFSRFVIFLIAFSRLYFEEQVLW